MDDDQRFKGQEAAATGLGFAIAVLSGEWKSWVINRVSSWGGMGWLRPQGPDLEDEQTLVNLAIEHAIRGLQDHLVAQKALQGFVADPKWHEIKVELAKNPRAHLDARHRIAFSRSQYSGLLPVNPDRVFDLFLRKFQALLTNNQGFLAVRSESRQQQEQVISAVHGTSTEILAVLGKMQNTQLLGSSATDPLVNASAQERAWYDRLTGIRALIRSYNLNQAERDLDRLATEFSDQTRIELRFEFASLKAGLAYYQNRMLEAAQYYEEAFKVDPDRALAKLHRGHAHLLRDEPREALVWIDRSLQGDLKVDQREAALAHKANALHALKSVQALEDLETHALASSKELRLALMHHAEQVKDFARVRALAEPVVESALQDGDARFAVLEALALWQQLEDAVVASGFSNRDEVALAAATDEGLHKISRAIDVLAATQNTRLHALARQVRMGFWMRAEHRNDARERALEDANRIRELVVDPSHGARNEAMLHCQMNNLEALRDALVRISDGQVDVGVAVASAQVLWDAGQPEEAFALLQRVPRPIPSDWLMPLAALGVLLIQNGENLPEAHKWVEGLRDHVGADHGLSLARALMATHEGRLEDAGDLFDVAITDPMEINRFLAREWYAKMLYNAGFVREAAVVLEPVITPTTDAPLLQLALQAAWEAYHYGTCMSALQALRAQGVRKRLNLYREGFILNFQGKLEPALKVMEEWVVLEPDHASPGIHRAFVLVRLGRPSEAVEEIKRALSVAFVGLEDLRASSGLLLQCGELDLAMAVAYRATRSYPDKADAHLDFVTALRSWSAPTSDMGVGLESAVQVRSVITKHEQTWIITDDPWSDLTRNEYRSEHPLPQAMLGKQVGDQVSIPGLVSPVQELFEIVKIEHKYISLGRAHAAAFNTRFPEDQRLKMVPFAPTAPESIEVLKQVIQERSQVWVVLQNMLFEGQLPVAKIGILAKLSPYETWDVFLEHPPGVLVFVDHEKLSSIQRAMRGGKAVVDLSSLMVLQRLGLLSVAAEQLELHIVLETREQLLEALNAPIHGRIGVNEGRLQRIEFDQGWIDAHRQRIRELIEFVDTHTRVTAADSIINFDPEDLELMGQDLPATFLLNVAAASDLGVPLLSECIHHRHYAREISQVNGVCVIMFAHQWAQSGIITPKQEFEVWQKALSLQLRFIRPPDRVIVQAVKADGDAFGLCSQQILASALHPQIAADGVAGVVAVMVSTVWQGQGTVSSLSENIRAMLDLVLRHHDASAIVPPLKRRLRKLMGRVGMEEPSEVFGLFGF